MDRRKMMIWLIRALSTLTMGVIAIPSALTVLAPGAQRRKGSVWHPLGPENDFPIGEVTAAALESPNPDAPARLKSKGVYVWRPTADETVVFSRGCTDLGCPVHFDRGSECYFCPCHGGIFAKNGDRLAGPPRRPLDRYALRRQNGVLEVDLNSIPPMA